MDRDSVGIKLVYFLLWSLWFSSIILFVSNLANGIQSLTLIATQFASINIDVTLRFDSLSTLLFVMVSMLGVAIGHYADRYLDGEERKLYFYRYLLSIILSVSLLVLSDNLLMFFLMWLATSHCLNKLLLYAPERPLAVLAARKRTLISRVGDAGLLGAIVLTYQVFGSFGFTEIFDQANSLTPGGDVAMQLSLIGLLIALGAAAISTQFPFHFWLPETMETPTPVSAVMHAGVVNAGGFLVIRLSPILQHATAANVLLTILGAVTAVFGALCMITQNDIKKKLAYSTMSQMGMMLFACGLGAYAVALFHIFAHSFYKAHAFLSTGTLVEEAKKLGFKLSQPPKLLFWTAATCGLLLVTSGMFYQHGSYFAVFTYGAVLFLGLLQNIGIAQTTAYKKSRVFSHIVLAMAIAMCVYVFIEFVMGQFLSDIVPVVYNKTKWISAHLISCFIAFGIFLTGFWLSIRLMNPNTVFFKNLYVYLWNGGYFGHQSSRILARLYPSPKI